MFFHGLGFSAVVEVVAQVAKGCRRGVTNMHSKNMCSWSALIGPQIQWLLFKVLDRHALLGVQRPLCINLK